MTIEERLKQAGIVLPTPAAPAANYVPFTRHGTLLHIAGQLPFGDDGSLPKGLLGESCDIEAGAAAARRCAVGILAQVKAALGDLEQIEQLLKLNVFVASAPGFAEQPRVANGASDLMVELLGDRGRHARSAVGVSALPLGVPVEIDAVVACRSSAA
jgi:enamine deaminase RidA (YjgF/YER057c/UK114 family)